MKLQVTMAMMIDSLSLHPSHSLDVGGNLKKQLTTKNIQENEAISNCKIE